MDEVRIPRRCLIVTEDYESKFLIREPEAKAVLDLTYACYELSAVGVTAEEGFVLEDTGIYFKNPNGSTPHLNDATKVFVGELIDAAKRNILAYMCRKPSKYLPHFIPKTGFHNELEHEMMKTPLYQDLITHLLLLEILIEYPHDWFNLFVLGMEIEQIAESMGLVTTVEGTEEKE